jgi:uncharacterized membrane protein
MSDATRPERQRRWLFAGLVASLALNAFFIGAAATDIIRLTESDKRPVHFELRWLETRLSADGFARVEAAVVAARPEAERHIARLQALRRELGMLAAEAEPDRAAIDAKLVEIRGELGLMVAGVQKTAIDAVLALPPDVRQPLASDGQDQP